MTTRPKRDPAERRVIAENIDTCEICMEHKTVEEDEVFDSAVAS
jgi:hypothetical protein